MQDSSTSADRLCRMWSTVSCSAVFSGSQSMDRTTWEYRGCGGAGSRSNFLLGWAGFVACNNGFCGKNVR
jgi:hypothetical protein